MELIVTYCVHLLSFSFGISLFIFAIIIFARRKERAVTPLKGLAIFSIGWLASTFVVGVIHLSFAYFGTTLQGGELEAPVSIVIVMSVMYVVFNWLSEARVGEIRK